jgi:hypothetical protein
VFSFYNAKTSRSIYYSGALLYPPNLRTILICVYQIAYWQWIYWIFQRLLSSNLHYSLLLLGFLMQNMVFHTVFYTILNILNDLKILADGKWTRCIFILIKGSFSFYAANPTTTELKQHMVEVGMSNCLMCVSLATIWYDRS